MLKRCNELQLGFWSYFGPIGDARTPSPSPPKGKPHSLFFPSPIIIPPLMGRKVFSLPDLLPLQGKELSVYPSCLKSLAYRLIFGLVRAIHFCKSKVYCVFFLVIL